MLDRILNKKIRVGVTFSAFQYDPIMNQNPMEYYEGVIVAYDDKFIVFEDNSMININYIQTIQIVK